MSSLSQRSIETLLDLVEIKLSCLGVYDREDAREKSCLENARRELRSMRGRRLAAVSPMAPGCCLTRCPPTPEFTNN